MENAQIIAERIKTIAKERNVSVKQLLSDCGIGPNTVTKLGHGTDILTATLCKIADYLDVSADYLLGRENSPLPVISETDWITLLDNLSDESLLMLRDYTRYLRWKQDQDAGDSP